MCDDCLDPAELSRRDTLRMMAAGSMILATGPRRRQRSAGIPPESVEVVPGLTILRRSAWAGSDHDPTRDMFAEDVRFLLVHHTASSNNYGPDRVIAVLQSAYRLHVGPERGFADIAYNFLIDRFGRVWEGRRGSLDGPVTADATGGSQGFAQLVCLIGDFTGELPSPEAIDALTRTLAWLADRFGVDTNPGATVQFASRGSNKWPAGEIVVAATISGHRDMSETACPGNAFYPMVRDELQSIVTKFRSDSAPIPTTIPAITAPPSNPPPTSTDVRTTTTVLLTTVPSSTASTTSSAAQASAEPASSPNEPTTVGESSSSGRGDNTVLGLTAGAVGLAVVGGIIAVRRGRGSDAQSDGGTPSLD